MTDAVYDMTIKDAVEILEKSDRQVRRYVKAGRLRAKPVRIDGHVKLMFNEEELLAFKETLAAEGAFGESGRQIVIDGHFVGEDAIDAEGGSAPESRSLENADAVKYVIDALREQIQELQKENKELHYQLEQRSGQVGFLQGKIDALQEEIKMLMPAQPSEEKTVERKPWYRRLFGLL